MTIPISDEGVRDFFAGQAINAMLSRDRLEPQIEDLTTSEGLSWAAAKKKLFANYAGVAYEIADAMLRHRNGGEN